jgi:hypothetical protein
VRYLSEKVEMLFKLDIEMGIPVVGQNYGEEESAIHFNKENKEVLRPGCIQRENILFKS